MDWSLTAAKSGKISVGKYMELRSSIKAREEALIKLYKEESTYLQLNNDLHEVVVEVRTQLRNMNANYDKLYGYSDVKTYNGHWELTYIDANGHYKTETVSLSMGDIYTTEREGKFLFKITRMGYSSQTSELMLIVQDQRDPTSKPQFNMVLYCPNNERTIFLNREPNQLIEKMIRTIFIRPE